MTMSDSPITAIVDALRLKGASGVRAHEDRDPAFGEVPAFPFRLLVHVLSALAFFASVLTASGSSLPPNKLTFVVQVMPLSNLVYQLDCLSGTVHCSRAAYLNLWTTHLAWSAGDQTQLERWKILREKYSGEIQLNEPKPEAMALPWSGPTGLQIDDKFSIATFRGNDRAALLSYLEVIVAPADLPRLEAVIKHFEPRFARWWDAEARAGSERFRQALQTRLAEKSVLEMVDSFARFYDITLPDGYPIYLNLFFRPKSDDTHTNGTQIENHAVVEFLPDEDVSLRLGVVIHELCHFFYSSGSDAHKRSLSRAFADSPDPMALAGLNIINEALATALGNGIAAERLLDSATFKKKLETERGFYNDPAIDATAKALVPFLKEQISAGRTVYQPTFVADYLATLETKVPSLLKRPAMLLTELTIVSDSEFADVVNTDIRRQLRGGIYPYEGIDRDESWAMLRTYPRLNALVVVSPGTLTQLAGRAGLVGPDDIASMGRAFGSSSSWIYSIRRFPSTYLFVLGGKSTQDVSEGFRRLMDAPDRFTGFLAR
jgi:hypothetical protein